MTRNVETIPTPEQQPASKYNGFLMGTTDEIAGGGGNRALAVATINFFKVPILRSGITTTNVNYTVTVAGVTITHAFLAWYDSSGAKILQSADQSAVWVSTGFKTLAFAVSPTYLGPGSFGWLALYLGTASTQAQFGATGPVLAGTGAPENVGCSTSQLRHGTLAQADTATLPASITPTGMAAGSGIILAAFT